MSDITAVVDQAMAADQDLITTIAVSLAISMMGFVGLMLLIVSRLVINSFNKTIANLEEKISACQAALKSEIKQIDDYGKENRKLSYSAKDGIAEHVKDFHTSNNIRT